MLKIEDVFLLKRGAYAGKWPPGVVAIGRWNGESFKVGDSVRCGERVYPVKGIERYCIRMGRPMAEGEKLGILLGDCAADDVSCGDTLELI